MANFELLADQLLVKLEKTLQAWGKLHQKNVHLH